jgi:4-hydroxybenzoate polyprenyltransferase
MQKLRVYSELTRLNKPIGILLLLWPTLWGLWLAAGGFPPIHILVIFVLGTVLMRSAGCAINDYADRDFDKHVARTAHRPVTTGKVSPREALYVAAACAVVAALLVIPLNYLVWCLCIPAVVLAGSYPYFKRFFAIPQAYLGIAFGFGIPMGFAAIQGEVPTHAWVLLMANVFWTIAYDTEYAMVDRADDLKIGIRTSAITFGQWDIAAVMLCYAMALGIWTAVMLYLTLSPLCWFGVLAAALIAVYHFTLIAQRQPAQCFKAFLHNNWFGAALFVGVVVGV